MCFRVTDYNKFCIYFEVLSVNTTMPTGHRMWVFGDNGAAEVHKLHRGIWQNLPRKNGGPDDKYIL